MTGGVDPVEAEARAKLRAMFASFGQPDGPLGHAFVEVTVTISGRTVADLFCIRSAWSIDPIATVEMLRNGLGPALDECGAGLRNELRRLTEEPG